MASIYGRSIPGDLPTPLLREQQWIMYKGSNYEVKPNEQIEPKQFEHKIYFTTELISLY